MRNYRRGLNNYQLTVAAPLAELQREWRWSAKVALDKRMGFVPDHRWEPELWSWTRKNPGPSNIPTLWSKSITAQLRKHLK